MRSLILGLAGFVIIIGGIVMKELNPENYLSNIVIILGMLIMGISLIFYFISSLIFFYKEIKEYHIKSLERKK